MDIPFISKVISIADSFFWFCIILFIIVSIHEFGHYAFAKLFGVKVEEFSIGFGKELFGFNDTSGTRWKICALPLGGYVKMFGDADPSSSVDFKKLNKMSMRDKKLAFHYKALWQKAIIIAAGPIANFILAALIFTGLFLNEEVATGTTIEYVEPNSPAEVAGLQVDDKIIMVDNEEIEFTKDIIQKIRYNLDNAIRFTVNRDGVIMEIELLPEERLLDESNPKLGKINFIGIGIAAGLTKRMNFLEALNKGVEHTYDISVITLEAVGQMITGARGTESIGGPLRIAEFSSKSAKEGINTFFRLVAIISINLGLINLFPIPLLDGGHLMFYLLEGIRRKPLNEQIQNMFMRFGLVLIITLMIYAFFNDIRHLLA